MASRREIADILPNYPMRTDSICSNEDLAMRSHRELLNDTGGVISLQYAGMSLQNNLPCRKKALPGVLSASSALLTWLSQGSIRITRLKDGNANNSIIYLYTLQLQPTSLSLIRFSVAKKS
nr:hypothetical protein CFP56_04640 [Quercus suber]